MLQVIAALAENQGGSVHIPYRDSKLTKVNSAKASSFERDAE